MILLIDNYDSFTHNLARYLRRLGQDVCVLRNDSADLEMAVESCQAIVISPGPCGPDRAGKTVAMIRCWSGRVPILGICLGHQAICYAFSGQIIRARRPIHGQALPIQLFSSPLFHGMESSVRFARYHSLVADQASLPSCLRVIAYSLPDTLASPTPEAAPTAWQPEIMAVQHLQHPTFGVQFHPESILSADGYRLLANFLDVQQPVAERPLPQSDLADPDQLSRWYQTLDHNDLLPKHDVAEHWLNTSHAQWPPFGSY
jgi:anthranilate synthase component 2/para-aminobenzoate synthetase component 2